VQLTYSTDPVDQEKNMFETRQHSLRDGDDGVSALQESASNSNNILAKNLRFDITQIISTYSFTVLFRDPTFYLFGTECFRFSPSDDYNNGVGDAVNVDNDNDDDDDDDDDYDDDDDDDDDDDSGYLHEAMETGDNLEMNGNRG
jgi:hypothetical protein